MPLICQNLCFSYGDRPVLTGVTLSLRAGEVVALLGPNGSGKSTLLRCLLGQLPHAGDVQWNDKPLRIWSRRELARHAAYLPQSLASENGATVADVLRMGRAPYLQAFGVESARDVQVVREVATLLGLADLLNRELHQLSGGQRQRVYIGRCLVQEPAVLLLDEPNTYLDLRHQVELGQLLRRLSREKNLAILLASHDLNLASQFADRLVLLEAGKVAAEGSAEQVLTAENLSRVYEVTMRIVRLDGKVFVFPAI